MEDTRCSVRHRGYEEILTQEHRQFKEIHKL